MDTVPPRRHHFPDRIFPLRPRTIGNMTSRTKPRRIALLFEYATLLGGERSMLACVDSLKTQAADVNFVAVAPPHGRLAEALTGRGVEIIPWMTMQPDGGRMSRELQQATLIDAVRRADPSVLHANSLSMGRLTGSIASQLQIPATAHLRDILHVSGAAMADLNRNALLIAVSHATRDAHVVRGLNPDRVVVVHNGLDLEQFQPRPFQGRLHRELNLPDSATLIATIGQIGLRKGQDILAAAAVEIVRAVPDVHFLLIGERSSTKAESIQFEQDIATRFADQGLESHLHCLGYRDDVPQILNELDLIVHPANQEPFGRVLLEAAASGVPVVATDVGGTAEIVVDGLTGRLVPPGDPASLANAVVNLLTDSTLLLEMSTAARQRAAREFNVSEAANQLLAHWQRVIECHDK